MTPPALLIALYGLLLVILSGGIVAGTVKPTWREFWQVLTCLVLGSGVLLIAIWVYVQFTAYFLSQLG